MFELTRVDIHGDKSVVMDTVDVSESVVSGDVRQVTGHAQRSVAIESSVLWGMELTDISRVVGGGNGAAGVGGTEKGGGAKRAMRKDRAEGREVDSRRWMTTGERG